MSIAIPLPLIGFAALMLATVGVAMATLHLVRWNPVRAVLWGLLTSGAGWLFAALMGPQLIAAIALIREGAS